MEQEETQISTPLKNVPLTPPDPLQIHFNNIKEAIKENTVALVEMGIKIQKLENCIDLLLAKGGRLG